MAPSQYHQALPIYRAAMDAAVGLDRALQYFAKRHRYTLGVRLQSASIDVLTLVGRAYRRERRAEHLEALVRRLDEWKTLVELAWEVRAFRSLADYVQVIEQVVNVARQAEGWRASTVSQGRPEPPRAPRGVS
jgi:hypothetical protein